jgi:hypothetical protein
LEDDIKLDFEIFKSILCDNVDWIYLAQDKEQLSMGSAENRNEPWGSIKCREFCD